MQFSITHFDNIMLPKSGKPETYVDFKSFCTKFKPCREAPTEEDKKRSAGWVRGLLKDNYRHNDNIDTTQFIIIDVDKSAGVQWCKESPESVHKALKAMNINHLIHTSWSNRPEQKRYRYRIIIPCTREIDRLEVEGNNEHIVKALNNLGLDIINMSENKAMSQMWFMPSSPKPDLWFETYEYHNGKDFKPETIGRYGQVTKQLPNESDINQDRKGYNGQITIRPDVAEISNIEMIRQIRTHESLHDNIRNLTYQIVSDTEIKGVRGFDYWTELFLSELMGPDIGDERVEERRADLKRTITGARTKVKEKMLREIEWNIRSIEYKDPPRAPGMLGQLIQEAYESQHYQNFSIATVSCLGMLSGIAGYKFQTPGDPTGCNNYYLISMLTGGGKDFCSKFPLRVMRMASKDDSYENFVGKGSFTGGKALRKMLEEKRTCLSVLSEMGKLLQTTSGDQATLRRAILTTYSRSGPTDIVPGEAYSKESDDIGALAHPAFSLIGEGEPVGFISALKASSSSTDGFVPRCLVFRAEGDRPHYNKNVRTNISQNILDHIAHLMKECADSADMPYFMHFETAQLEEEALAYCNYWVDIYNSYKGDPENELKFVLSTRTYVHCLKLATICAVMNKRGLFISRDEWDWAKSMTEYCFQNSASFMEGGEEIGDGDGTLDGCLELVKKRLADHFMKSVNANSGKYYRDQVEREHPNVIREDKFMKLFKNAPKVKKLARQGQSGYEVLFKGMKDAKYLSITPYKYDKKDCRYFQIQEKILNV